MRLNKPIKKYETFELRKILISIDELIFKLENIKPGFAFFNTMQLELEHSLECKELILAELEFRARLIDMINNYHLPFNKTFLEFAEQELLGKGEDYESPTMNNR